MSMGMAVPVDPRYCCNAEVRYDRVEISSRFCTDTKDCDEDKDKDLTERWRYEYGGFRRVMVVRGSLGPSLLLLLSFVIFFVFDST